MKAGKIEQMVRSQGTWHAASGQWCALVRYAAMVVIDLPDWQSYSDDQAAARQIEIPIDATQKILALDFSERASSDLRALGEGCAKISVNVPSNINVWQHLKGESRLANAADGLREAAKLLSESITQ